MLFPRCACKGQRGGLRYIIAAGNRGGAIDRRIVHGEAVLHLPVEFDGERQHGGAAVPFGLSHIGYGQGGVVVVGNGSRPCFPGGINANVLTRSGYGIQYQAKGLVAFHGGIPVDADRNGLGLAYGTADKGYRSAATGKIGGRAGRAVSGEIAHGISPVDFGSGVGNREGEVRGAGITFRCGHVVYGYRGGIVIGVVDAHVVGIQGVIRRIGRTGGVYGIDGRKGNRAVHDGVIHTGDRNGLGGIPVGRREGEGGGGDGSFTGVAAADVDHNHKVLRIGRRLTVQHHRVSGRCSVFANGKAFRSHGKSCRIVVFVDQVHIVHHHTVVVGVGRNRIRTHQGIVHVPVCDLVVLTRNGDGLGRIPVGRGKGEAQGSKGVAFRRVPARPAKADVAGGFGVQHHGKGGGIRVLRGGAAGRGHGNARRIVVDIGYAHVLGIHVEVARSGVGFVRIGRDQYGVGNVSVVHIFIDTGYGYCLGRIPVGRGKGELGNRNRTLGKIAADQIEDHVPGWNAGQGHGKGVRAEVFRGRQAHAAGDHGIVG